MGRSAEPADVDVYFVDLEQAAGVCEAEEERTPRLSGADIERAEGMADGAAGRLWRTSRIATRILLERAGGTGLRRVAFKFEPGGRPVLAEGAPHFSISHTGGIALVAVSKAAPVGVDIEAKARAIKMSADRRERIIAAAARLSPQEALSAQSDFDVLTAWVQLEAAAKALGIGIGRLLTETGVIGGRGNERAEFGADVPSTRTLAVEEPYIAAIAAERLPATPKVTRFPHENLAAFLKARKP